MSGNVYPLHHGKVCMQVLAFCRCTRIGEHTAHICPCGGSWAGEGHDIQILSLPTANHPRLLLLDRLYRASVVGPERDDGPLPKERS